MSTFVQLQDKIMNHFGASDQEFRDEVKEAINDIIAEINDEVPQAPHLETSTTLTTTADSTTVSGSMPSDYDHILQLLITVDGKKKPPLIYLSREEWNVLRLFDRGSDVPTHFSLFDGTLYVGPPANGAYTLTLEYYKFDSSLTDSGDTSLLTDHYARWERVVVEGVKSRMHEFLATDSQMIELSNVKYQNGIKRFRNWVRRNFQKNPNASRVRGWKEIHRNLNPLIPEQLRY